MLLKKDFFSDPKVMATSGLITMIGKLIMTFGISLMINFFINRNTFALMFILFPLIALISDLFLYLYKDLIWVTLPSVVPLDWAITSEQLLTYAKTLPKVRLMRFLGSWFLIPFIDLTSGWNLVIEITASITIGFLIFSLFDTIWLNIFKIKKPFASNNNSSHCNLVTQEKEPFSYMQQRYAKDIDASSPGSIAWFAKQHLDSL